MKANRLQMAAMVSIGWGCLTWLTEIRHAMAHPTHGTVVEGQATIDVLPANPDHQVIQQSTSKVIIDWGSFSNKIGETTVFRQPSSSSIALNRVTGLEPSVISGSIQANGQVWLINPYGILFNKTAKVDVASFLGTTSSISNHDFMSNQYRFVPSDAPPQPIINEGSITVADKGFVYLVAPAVRNSHTGVIQAKRGTVHLASGSIETLDFHGDGLIQFAVPTTDAVLTPIRAITPSGRVGEALKDGVSNAGTLVAEGGKVALTVSHAKHVVENAINMQGVIKADTAVKNQKGEIVLSSTQGRVRVNGTLGAKGVRAGEQGGKITITGQHVAIGTTQAIDGKEISTRCDIDASGEAGGGRILLGGEEGGRGRVPQAETVYVSDAVTAKADAGQEGDGGSIITWSNRFTQFNGSASARGGKTGGNGGWGEISSGKQFKLGKAINLNFTAPKGSSGALVLDPYNVTIRNEGQGGGHFSDENPAVWTPTGNGSGILATTIQNLLNAGTHVTIRTSGVGGLDPGLIIVESPIIIPAGLLGPQGPVTLRLEADNNIEISPNARIVDHSGFLSLFLQTPRSVLGHQNALITVADLSLRVGTAVSLGNIPGTLTAASVGGLQDGTNIDLGGMLPIAPNLFLFNGYTLPRPVVPPLPTTPTTPTNMITTALGPGNFPTVQPTTPTIQVGNTPPVQILKTTPPTSTTTSTPQPPLSSPPQPNPVASPPSTPPTPTPPAMAPTPATPMTLPAPPSTTSTPPTTVTSDQDIPIGGGNEGQEPIRDIQGTEGQEGIVEDAFNVERTETTESVGGLCASECDTDQCPIDSSHRSQRRLARDPVSQQCLDDKQGPLRASDVADALNKTAPIGLEGVNGTDVPMGAFGIGDVVGEQEAIESIEGAEGREGVIESDLAVGSPEDINRTPEYLENLGPLRDQGSDRRGSIWHRRRADSIERLYERKVLGAFAGVVIVENGFAQLKPISGQQTHHRAYQFKPSYFTVVCSPLLFGHWFLL